MLDPEGDKGFVEDDNYLQPCMQGLLSYDELKDMGFNSSSTVWKNK